MPSSFLGKNLQGEAINLSTIGLEQQIFYPYLRSHKRGFRAALACLVLTVVGLGPVGCPESLGEDCGVAVACSVQLAQGSQERDYGNNFFHTCEAACAWKDQLI